MQVGIGKTIVWESEKPFAMFLWLDPTVTFGPYLSGYIRGKAFVRKKEWTPSSPIPVEVVVEILAKSNSTLNKKLAKAVTDGSRMIFIKYLGVKSWKGGRPRPRFVVRGVSHQREEEIMKEYEIPASSVWG